MVTSPASGVIFKKDPSTGADLPVNSTLGPVFTERADTIGKGRFFIGFTHQNFHFTEMNGKSLNGMTLLDPGGANSSISVSASSAVLKSKPVTKPVCGARERASAKQAISPRAVASQYGWYQICGLAVALKTAVTVNPQVTVFLSGTAGRVKVVASAGLQVVNCRSANLTTVTSTTSTITLPNQRLAVQRRHGMRSLNRQALILTRD